MKMFTAVLVAVLILVQIPTISFAQYSSGNGGGGDSSSDNNYVPYALLAAAVIVVFWLGFKTDKEEGRRAQEQSGLALGRPSKLSSIMLVTNDRSKQWNDEAQQDLSAGLAYSLAF